MTPTPRPPTRLTVSGGPKAEPILSTIDTPKRDPYRMAHPMRKSMWPTGPSFWAVVVTLFVLIIFLAFNVDVR